MIIKGASRAGPRQLATHLLRVDTNERVEILELHSPIGELKEAFRDWQVLSEGTRGSKGLYHANIDPAKGYEMTREQWLRSVDVLEKELGFDGQPRAIVLHKKEGREHIHVVWQRTDVESMTLKSDSWNYKAHEKASQALELEFGHEHVPGKHAKRDRRKQPEPPKSDINHAEWQQKDRTGVDPRDRKEQIQKLYAQSDSPQAFRAALAEEGYILATGDKRTYVLVDQAGEIYSLTRQLKGERAADVRAFLAPLTRESIPDIEEARRQQAERPTPEPEPQRANDSPSQQEQSPKPDEQDRAAEALAAQQAEDLKTVRATYEAEVRETTRRLDQALREKMEDFDAQQKAERDRFQEETREQRKGIAGYRKALDERLRPAEAADRKQQRDKAWHELVARQKIERRDHYTLLKQNRNQEIDALIERYADQIKAFERLQKEQPERYRQEYQEAEDRRQKAEREKEEQRRRSRDGPDRDR